ncbi:hypothetical protein KDL45_04875 [bacterium]|nr:hypothetical protein [bacterium]
MDPIGITLDTGTGYTTDATATSEDLLSKGVFLELLVTQMQYQDPLDPMDNQQFLDQLASLSTVEELRTSNSNLETIQLYQSSINNAQSVALVGKDVKAIGDTVTYDGAENVKLHFKLNAPAASTEITIYDESGTVVRVISQSDLDEGDQTVTWNGNDKNGSPLSAGTYTFEVNAKTSEGDPVASTTFLSGRVEGVSYGSGVPELIVQGQRVMIGDIYEVGQ